MAVKSYVGVSNIARKINKAYVGVNGVARKVNKIYTGVNDVAELVYTAPLEIVTWSGGTDEQIVAMVEASDAGLINLSDYWSVGDTRTVSLSAMSATGVGESHEAQNVELVLMNAGGKTLANATPSGRTTCSFIVGLKNSLNEMGYMNSTNTNVGGWTSSARRTWCNNVFKNSIPSTLRPIFKQFKNKTSAGNISSTINTDVDTWALPAEIEVLGTTQYSYAGEGSQFTWYATLTNRIKKVNGSDYHWWERSPRNGSTTDFTNGHTTGSASGGRASTSLGISPFGCI